MQAAIADNYTYTDMSVPLAPARTWAIQMHFRKCRKCRKLFLFFFLFLSGFPYLLLPLTQGARLTRRTSCPESGGVGGRSRGWPCAGSPCSSGSHWWWPCSGHKGTPWKEREMAWLMRDMSTLSTYSTIIAQLAFISVLTSKQLLVWAFRSLRIPKLFKF